MRSTVSDWFGVKLGVMQQVTLRPARDIGQSMMLILAIGGDYMMRAS
jgi:hypothetical protein